jgi:hypothetical protein
MFRGEVHYPATSCNIFAISLPVGQARELRLSDVHSAFGLSLFSWVGALLVFLRTYRQSGIQIGHNRAFAHSFEFTIHIPLPFDVTNL